MTRRDAATSLLLLAALTLVPLGTAGAAGGKSDSDDDDSDDDDDKPDKMPDAAQLKEDAQDRFPQPIRAGALIGRDVLEPVASRRLLGRVRSLVQGKDGVDVIVDYGGWFGFGAHPIAVPADAMTLLGPNMQIVAYTPEQLRGFPTFDAAGAKTVDPDTVLEIGISKPSH